MQVHRLLLLRRYLSVGSLAFVLLCTMGPVPFSYGEHTAYEAQKSRHARDREVRKHREKMASEKRKHREKMVREERKHREKMSREKRKHRKKMSPETWKHGAPLPQHPPQHEPVEPPVVVEQPPPPPSPHFEIEVGTEDVSIKAGGRL